MTDNSLSALSLKARASALASLAMREHASHELAEKLLRKEHPSQIVYELIDTLQSEGLLSNLRFAEMYWRSRSSKGYGAVKIRIELEHKRVEADDIESGLIAANVNFESLIQQTYIKKYKSQPIRDYKDKSKRMNYLYNRGYSVDEMRWIPELSS